MIKTDVTLPLYCFAALEFYHNAYIDKSLSYYARFSNDKNISLCFIREWNVGIGPKRKYRSSSVLGWIYEMILSLVGDCLKLEIPIIWKDCNFP